MAGMTTPSDHTHATRRGLLLGGAALAVTACADPSAAQNRGAGSAAERRFANDPARRISDAEWRRRLPADAYRVLRHEDTERPGTSPLNGEHRRGTFHCRGCDLPLFRSEWKFDSGTGWPSFFRVIEENIGRQVDRSIPLMVRTEYHCARCLGHQGHVFDDGPRPTGLRYCNNGVALRFAAA